MQTAMPAAIARLGPIELAAGTAAGRAVLSGWGFDPHDAEEVTEALHDLEQSYDDEDDT